MLKEQLQTATCPPLCLEPDVNLTRIVNAVVRASTPSESVVLKRKQVHEPEEDENDKAKRAKLWSQYMHPHKGKPTSQA
jgi:transcription factor SPT20